MPTTRETATLRRWTCGRRLRERRIALGLTQAELVRRLDGSFHLTNRSISSWENGRGLDFGWLPELAAALDCTVTYLLGLTDDPRSWQPDDDARQAATRPSEPHATGTPAVATATPTPADGHRNWILGPGLLPPDRVQAAERS